MPRTTSPMKLLSERLFNDIPQIGGWTASQGASGSWTVTTPRGVVRIPAAEKWTPESAQGALERLQDKGMDTLLARKNGKAAKGGAKNGHAIAPTEAEKTPPAYPGDPSPDDGPVQRTVLLTPEVAQELLNRPWEATTSDGKTLRQRKLERVGVDFFSELLRKKKFKQTYQGLGIGINGSLYDGQHRCTAVVETGIAAEVTVSYNVHPDHVLQIDSGRQRRASTKLSMEGFEHALDLGSAARLLHYYRDYALAQSMGDDNGELVSEWRKWCNNKINDLQVDEIVHENPDLYPDLLWAIENKSARKHAPKPAAVAVLRYIAREAWPTPKCEKLMADFLDAAVKGVGITSEKHIALTLQRWIEKTGEKAGPRVRYMREAHLFALIKAWNHFVNPPKKPVMAFTEHLGTKFPLPYSPEPAE